jgi:hypothetical protein
MTVSWALPPSRDKTGSQNVTLNSCAVMIRMSHETGALKVGAHL